MSLAIHPAPLTKIPPKIINPKSNKEGGAVGDNHKDHPAGMSSINLPLGLFHLRRSNQCFIFWLRKLFTEN